ncbi:MAG: ATP synthase F1 subunit delta [Deltaproteobacteria bacterium]|nr:ATP synthase F1 subunit delta [Deltaproteobacteria bacterium]
MAASQDKVGKRYARALFTATAPAALESTREALHSFAKTWSDNLQLREAMANPAVPHDQRLNVIKEVAKAARMEENLSNFLVLLVTNARISALPQIAKSFSIMVDEVKKLVALDITSAFPMEDSERSVIASKVQKDFGSLATISWHVDRALLGGLTVKNGDKLLDGSVKGSLERVRTLLDA